MPEKIKIIYIAGTSRSGSTLLDMILGSAPEAFSLGEVSSYANYRAKQGAKIKKPNYHCTCGKFLDECIFWKNVNERVAFNYDESNSAHNNFSLLKFILTPKQSKIKNRSYDDYELYSAAIASAKESNSKVEYLVDSSKSPIRLRNILNNTRLEIFPIFLVRDGRGVINSLCRSSNKKWSLKNNNFGRALLLWVFTNLSISRLLKNNPHRIHISYEKFCRDPKPFLNKIKSLTNINLNLDNPLQTINTTFRHNLDGNVIKLNPPTEITKDEKWKHELPWAKRLLATTIMYPFHKKWVYLK